MPQSEHPTQQYIQLPPGYAPPNGMPVPMPGAGYPGMPMQPAPWGAVPVVPPAKRSAGFWVGITAAIAAGVILALLAGFFIGRGTRLSNDAVQGKITEQSQADQIAQQKQLSDQKAADQTAENRAVTTASTQNYNRGHAAGYTDGYQKGYSTGQNSGFNQGQASGQAQGLSQGIQQGTQQGLSQGIAQGTSSTCASAQAQLTSGFLVC